MPVPGGPRKHTTVNAPMVARTFGVQVSGWGVRQGVVELWHSEGSSDVQGVTGMHALSWMRVRGGAEEHKVA